MADVIELNYPGRLAEVRMAWNALHPQTPGASFFHSIDWLEAYWKSFGVGRGLRVLVVRALGRPIGIVPLCIEARPGRLRALRVLTYPSDRDGSRLGPIGPNQTATLLLAVRHIEQTERDWDVFEPTHVTEDGADRGRTYRAMRLAGMTPTRTPHERHPSVNLAGFSGWEDYLASRGPGLRARLSASMSCLAKSGRVELIRHRPAAARDGDGDPRWDLYDQTVDIDLEDSSQRARGSARGGYHAAFHAAAARLGMLDLALLKVDGRPAAYLYGTHFQGRVGMVRAGCTAGFGDAAVADALTAMSLRDSLRRGDSSFGLLASGWPCTSGFETDHETSYRLTYDNRGRWLGGRWRGVRWLGRTVRYGQQGCRVLS